MCRVGSNQRPDAQTEPRAGHTGRGLRQVPGITQCANSFFILAQIGCGALAPTAQGSNLFPGHRVWRMSTTD